ncbi:MAG: sn-glycerol-1-phosphate dehydrogenase [Provencibacterium sp.]|jgi:glycerol-1-phosphate dehydrogenase [NAD(P)+]|nr:sn-glycerol-1-phosphate dehydrogenase [Provencibacterium sp.]
MQIPVQEFSKPCPCGHKHDIFVRDIRIGKGVLSCIPGLLREGGFSSPTVVCDENTFAAAGERIVSLLGGCPFVSLSPEGLHADEHAVEKLLSLLTDKTDILIAVGSGTVHDITRYCANERRIPFFSVPTAASVDGFVSTVAAMTWHGFKKSFIAVSPLYVVADSEIFSKAPARLTAAGIGDLLGKYTAIADWRIAHEVTGEYLCERICGMELEAIRTVCENLTAIRAGDEQASEQLMYGLLLSGLAMQMIGNSRPASGSEHHMSHLWEMEVINPHTDAYHGEKVGAGLLYAAKAYHAVRARILDKKLKLKEYKGLETALLEETFGRRGLTESLLEENSPDPLLEIQPQKLLESLPRIAQILGDIPAPENLRGLLARAEAPLSLTDIGLEEDICPLTLRLSPYVRRRLTFMRLIKLFDLDIQGL